MLQAKYPTEIGLAEWPPAYPEPERSRVATVVTSRRSSASSPRVRRKWIPSVRSQQVAARDAALVGRFQAGDETAFDEIFSCYHQKLIFVALRIVHDRHDAEEIALDALTRAYRALPFFRGDCALDTWLTAIRLRIDAYPRPQPPFPWSDLEQIPKACAVAPADCCRMSAIGMRCGS
jgi:hypothetical protein